ncbi:hypothetical protein BsWGS_05302 [Bradybaena similaris]
MRRPKLRSKSYSHYLSALAVFDSLVLISQEMHMLNESLPQPGLFYGFSHDACKIYVFVDSVCNLMSSWLIAVMAMERLCVVCMPFLRNMWCRQRGAVIIIFTLVTVLACTQMFRFVMVENHQDQCVGSPDQDYIYIPLHIYVYQFALLFITPVVVVIVCNTGVLIRIFSVEKATHNENSSSTRLTGNVGRHSKTTRMLIAISFTYLATTLPLIMLTITVHLLHQHAGNQFAHTFLKILPWMHFLQAVTNLNYASNFFIYILSGEKFRVELRRMFSSDSGSSYGAGSTRTREEIIMNSY